MQNFWRFCRWLILFGVIIFAIIFWLLGGLIKGISRNPQLVTGARPMGAGIVIRRVWARGTLRFLRWARRHFGRYVQRHHPRAYQRTQRLFQ